MYTPPPPPFIIVEGIVLLYHIHVFMLVCKDIYRSYTHGMASEVRSESVVHAICAMDRSISGQIYFSHRDTTDVPQVTASRKCRRLEWRDE